MQHTMISMLFILALATGLPLAAAVPQRDLDEADANDIPAAKEAMAQPEANTKSAYGGKGVPEELRRRWEAFIGEMKTLAADKRMARSAARWTSWLSESFRTLNIRSLKEEAKQPERDEVDALIDKLRHGNAFWRAEAAHRLANAGDMRAADPLHDALEDPDRKVREHAALALARLGDRRAVENLLHDLEAEEPTVRREAARALGSLGDERAIKALVERLKDPAPYVGRVAAEALGKIGGADVCETLIETLEHSKHAEVRAGAAKALGSIEGDKGTAALIGALGDKHWPVAKEAAACLAKMRSRVAVEPLCLLLKKDDLRLKAGFFERHKVVHDDVMPGGTLIHALLDDTLSPEEQTRLAALRALLRIGAKRAIPTLIGALDDKCPEIRAAAAGGLGRMGDPAAADALAGLLRDREDTVRRKASIALWRLGKADRLPRSTNIVQMIVTDWLSRGRE